MARKVFISVLGTGFYEEAIYAAGPMTLTTRFAQQASLAHFGAADWGENDRIFILLTESSRTSNWAVPDNKRLNRRTGQEEAYIGLKDSLDAMSLKAKVEGIAIPQDGSEKDIWQIFDTVFTLLADGDELYFDLTHGFRYLPMFILVLGNYARFMKGTTVCGVTYGNYEGRDRTTGRAPLVDLLPLVALQEWTAAGASYVQTGDAHELTRLGERDMKMFTQENLKRFGGGTEEFKAAQRDINKLKAYLKNLEAFTTALRFCRGTDVFESATLRTMRSSRPEQVSIPPLIPLLQRATASFEDFCPYTSAINTLEAARWCYDNELYQAAATWLQEGITTFFCARHGLDVKTPGQRMVIDKALIKKTGRPDYQPFEDEAAEQLVDKVMADPMMTAELVKTSFDFREIRNDFNHCGMKQNQKKISKLKDGIKKAIDTVQRVIGDARLLLNLSNHPYADWSDEQKEAAKVYGECRDLPFPAVDPQASPEEIKTLTDKYAEEISRIALTHRVTVHVMGEMCFTVAIVDRLKKLDILAIASTSERISTVLPDGSKNVTFHFTQFRPYAYAD